MATKRELHIQITPSGEVNINVKCIAGTSCTDASRAIEEALGGAIKHRELTDEYYALNPNEGHCAASTSGD
jgi:hypothetical protein